MKSDGKLNAWVVRIRVACWEPGDDIEKLTTRLRESQVAKFPNLSERIKGKDNKEDNPK